ncbi:MAG: iron transporter [Lachnospiraceae bacterium]|nr:iron transporter [Lachnospiraceae bacterium]
MKKYLLGIIFLIMCIAVTACSGGGQQGGGNQETTPAEENTPVEETTSADETTPAAVLPDGVYTADFNTDSTMFHANETCDGKGTLTVENGQMTIHVTLAGKGILNLFPGTAEDAQAPGAQLLEPTLDTVTYSDGMTEEVNGFDIPVPYLDAEFDCALIGKKGEWYDHKVSVSNPVPALSLTDGEYTIEVTLTGGSGKASVNSPAKLFVENGELTAEIVWSSSHYEYMTIDDVQYDPVTLDGGSTFIIPVVLDADMNISALTTAMSEPHLIDYVLHFDSSTIK